MLIEIDWKPDRRRLRTFGLVMLPLLAAIGAILAWRFRAPTVFYVCAGIGAISALSGLASPPLARVLYVAWMGIGLAIGSVVMPILVAIVYFGVITPIGLALRLAGRDSMRRRRLPPGESYWVELHHRTEARFYERQF
ncbi:hypothetical protein JW916_13100 [Candidatus Sumerlaeota bacterium]|nr:hypothetical protein [Candidatus Sumerlaeota bacterium]